MTIQTTTMNAPFGAVATLRMVNAIQTAFGAFSTWNDARLTRNALSQLSAAQLADIGLSRSDF